MCEETSFPRMEKYLTLCSTFTINKVKDPNRLLDVIKPIQFPPYKIVNDAGVPDFIPNKNLINYIKDNPKKIKKFIKLCRDKTNIKSLIFYIVFEVVPSSIEYLQEMSIETTRFYSFLTEAVNRNRMDVIKFCLKNPYRFSKSKYWVEGASDVNTLRYCEYIYPKDVRDSCYILLSKSILNGRDEIVDFLVEKYGHKTSFKVFIKNYINSRNVLSYHITEIILSNYIDILVKLPNWTLKLSDESVFDLIKSYNLVNKINFMSSNISVEKIRDNENLLEIENYCKIYFEKDITKLLISVLCPKINFDINMLETYSKPIDIFSNEILNMKNFNKFFPYLLPDLEGKTIDGKDSPYSIPESNRIIDSIISCCKIYNSKIIYNFESRLWEYFKISETY